MVHFIQKQLLIQIAFLTFLSPMMSVGEDFCEDYQMAADIAFHSMTQSQEAGEKEKIEEGNLRQAADTRKDKAALSNTNTADKEQHQKAAQDLTTEADKEKKKADSHFKQADEAFEAGKQNMAAYDKCIAGDKIEKPKETKEKNVNGASLPDKKGTDTNNWRKTDDGTWVQDGTGTKYDPKTGTYTRPDGTDITTDQTRENVGKWNYSDKDGKPTGSSFFDEKGNKYDWDPKQRYRGDNPNTYWKMTEDGWKEIPRSYDLSRNGKPLGIKWTPENQSYTDKNNKVYTAKETPAAFKALNEKLAGTWKMTEYDGSVSYGTWDRQGNQVGPITANHSNQIAIIPKFIQRARFVPRARSIPRFK